MVYSTQKGGCTSQTKQNHYFVATEHDSEAAPKGQERGSQRRGSEGPHIGLFFFGPAERNKMTEVLLR